MSYNLCSKTYLNVEDGVTAVDHIKRVLCVFLGGAVSNLKLNRARAPDGTLYRERNHVDGKIDAEDMDIIGFSHVEVASSDATPNIEHLLASFQIQLVHKFFCGLCYL